MSVNKNDIAGAQEKAVEHYKATLIEKLQTERNKLVAELWKELKKSAAAVKKGRILQLNKDIQTIKDTL